jgi:hypothetical protein
MECTPNFLLFLAEIHVFEVNFDFSSATSSLTAIFPFFFTIMLSQVIPAKPFKFSKISELVLFANVLSIGRCHALLFLAGVTKKGRRTHLSKYGKKMQWQSFKGIWKAY